jgi:hypothetical protein
MKFLVWLPVALLATVVLSVGPNAYHITYDPSMDVIQLIIWSDSNQDPYEQFADIEVEKSSTSVDIPRHPLPKGSYVIQAQEKRWEGCPTRCELVAIDSSKTVIINVAKDSADDPQYP